MDDAELNRLRRFSLAVGLILITYLLAGINVEPNSGISAFGVPFRIARPDLLPVGLAIASFCAAVRFHYYGLMLATSPHRKRRDLLDGLTEHHEEHHRPGKPVKLGPFTSGSALPMYWGPRKFGVSPWHYDRQLMERRAASFENAFPKFWGGRATVEVVQDTFHDEDGDEHPSYNLDIIIPRRCRAAALFEDTEYTARIWLNVIALLCYAWRLVT
jgi:hypothetical protein